MGRAPCCEKVGLKKGPWTPEEDQILINYINTYGHANWRALPKHAGLLRCGKSCRLRWTNYLRPDIKRGNITREEEDEIIKLHEMLGNRWSAIAAKLPGRTDNEIKNVWHTHLKKRLPQHQQQNNRDPKRNKKQSNMLDVDAFSKSNQDVKQQEQEVDGPQSPPQCSSDMSSLTTSDNNNNNNSINSTTNQDINMFIDNNDVDSPENNLALDEDFWLEVLSSENSSDDTIGADYQFQLPIFSPLGTEERVLSGSSSSTGMCDGMDFWYDVYARAEEITEVLEL